MDVATEEQTNRPPSTNVSASPATATHATPISPTSAAASSSSHCGNGSIFAGMTRTAPDAFEVWMHGDCTVWSPGVHIVGARIVGLEAAVWTAARHRCTECQQFGAMMACLARGCERQVHVPCGRNSDWTMCENDLKTHCAQHSATLLIDGKAANSAVAAAAVATVSASSKSTC